MTNLTKYRKLDQIEFALQRPDSWLGSIFPVESDTWVIEDKAVIWKKVTYFPALLKLFDEVLQNAYDHSTRPEGKNLTKVDVTINRLTGEISVFDNGGIPVQVHPEYNQYIPDIIFGELMSGENYNDTDERAGAGTNGLGAKLTNIWSTSFRVETADGKKRYEKTYSNNMRTASEPKISNSSLKYTKITFVPDYARMGSELDFDNSAMLERRVFEVAAVAPHLSITLNGESVVRGFKQFTDLFGGALYAENEDWQIGLNSSGSRGLTQISFVNGTNTSQGGTHVDYILDQVIEVIRAHIKKKTKQDIKPSELKNHFTIHVNSRIVNPRFSGQTKEILVTPVSKFGSSFKLDDKFLRKVISSSIVSDIIEWAERKKELDDAREARAAEKDKAKKSLKHILKYDPANEKTNRSACSLFICEGDSAKNPLMSARDPKLHGVFPLRGKILNVRGMKISEVAKNEEIMNLKAILGLEFGEEPVIEKMRYRKLICAKDADFDGSHIFGLLINLFYTFWPSLLKQDFLYALRTPIIKSIYKGKEYEFFDVQSFHDFELKYPNAKATYLKGLGSNETKSFKRYMFESEYLIPYNMIDLHDEEMLEIAFSVAVSAADNRKQWLYKEQ